MNVFQDFTARVGTAVRRALSTDRDTGDIDLSRVVIEPPRDAGHGDLTTNAAMVLAKPLAAKPRDLADNPDPLGFLVHDNAAGGGATSVVDAAYRFVRHEPGVDVVLFGTGDVGHLKTNIASLLKPPLPEADRERLARLFGHLVGVGLDAPHLSPRTGRVTNG